MLAIAVVIVLRRRSIVLTRSRWKVIVVGKYEHGKEVAVYPVSLLIAGRHGSRRKETSWRWQMREG